MLWAGLSLAAALAAAPAVRWLDRETGWTVFGYSPDGARAVLGALSGAMLTFIVFVLSATLIVVQLASGQLTPRVIALVFATRWVRLTLMSLTFTFTYTLSALGRVDPFHLTAIRYLVASLVLLAALAVVEGTDALRLDGRGLHLAALGALGFAGFNLLAFTGLAHAPAQVQARPARINARRSPGR